MKLPAPKIPLLVLTTLSLLACSGDGASGTDGSGASSSASGGSGANGTGTGGQGSTGTDGTTVTSATGSTTSTASTSSSNSTSSGGDGGGGGGGLVDTCPVPTGAFTVDAVPNPGSNTNRWRVALQVPTSGDVGLYTIDSYGNGSFYNELVKRFHKSGPDWSYDTIVDEEWGFSVATALATTDGDDPCFVYTKDYDGQIRLVCASISDRVVAPGHAYTLAMAADGATKHMVRVVDGRVDWFTTDGGTPTVPEVVEASVGASSISMAVDASGTPHVAYVTRFDGGGTTDTMEIHYAKRVGGTWEITTVDSETIGNNVSDDRLAVSLALDPSGHPSIAYHHHTTRSLRIATSDGIAFAAPVTLDTPQPGYPNDDLGRSVALAIDCYGRKRVVYQRDVTTDPTPDSHLAHALVGPSGLTDRVMLPLVSQYYTSDTNLSYKIDPAGHDHVGVMAGALQYVTR